MATSGTATLNKKDSDLFTIFVGISQPDKRSVELVGFKPISKKISRK